MAQDHRPEHPVPDFEVDDEGKFTRFAVKQSGAAPGAGETRVHRLAVGIYDDAGAADSATSGASGKLVRIHREELTSKAR